MIIRETTTMKKFAIILLLPWILGGAWRRTKDSSSIILFALAQEDEDEPAMTMTNTPNLPIGDIQVLVVTDTHSWVGGHGDKEELDADYGDVVSFFRHLQSQLRGKDLFFVMNGDWIDGTGLALNGDPSYLTPILERMPWDAVTVGNHELYEKSVIDYMSRPAGFIDWWGSKYLSSNVIHSDNQANLGNQFRLLKGPTSTVLAFGFLYDMKDNDPSVTVQEVETVVEQSWFTSALKTPGVDAILVLGHMGHDDPLVTVILQKIRQILGSDMPVQFITGHTHIRAVRQPDDTSSSFEAGRYLDTVGFVSFPRKSTVQAATTTLGSNTTALFQHRFIDAKRETLHQILNGPQLETEEGRQLSEFIHRIQRELGLREVVGCVPERYYFDKSILSENSVWGLFERQVVPKMFEENNVLMMSTPSARYDLLPGDLILDEVIAMYPFNETLWSFANIPGDILLQLNATINAKTVSWMPALPPYTFASAKPVAVVDENTNSTLISDNVTSDTAQLYNLITGDFSLHIIQSHLAELYPQIPQPVALPNTGLQVWLKFFREQHLCKTSEHGNHRPSAHPNQGNNRTGMPHMNLPEMTPEKKDQVRLIFAFVGSGLVLLLGAVHVWQRGSNWRQVSHAREMATIEAWREFEGEDDDNELI